MKSHFKHGKENHYWAQDGAQELRPEHAHLLRYRGTYCFEHNPKGHGMKATLVFPSGTEGFWLLAKFDEQMNYPEDEDPTPAGVWITFSRESFQIDEEPANSLQGEDDEEPANSLQGEDGGCRGIKGLDHRWVPGIITGALYCSKCRQPKDLEDVKARFMDRMGLAEAQTEQQPVEMGELRVRLENGHKQFEFEEYSAAYALPDGTHYLYTAPIAQTEQPVAWRDETGTLYPSRESVAKYLPEGRIATPLYAAPIAQTATQPEQSGWISVEDRLPESGRHVLAYYTNSLAKGRRIRAEYVAPKSREVDQVHADFDTQCVEHDEESDCFYLTSGWYELMDNWDEYTSIAVVEGEVTHWMPLPAAPASCPCQLPLPAAPASCPCQLRRPWPPKEASDGQGIG